MSRRNSRENVFKLIYERIIQGEKNALTFNHIINSEAENQRDYIAKVYNGVDEKFEFLKKVISEYTVSGDFSGDRIYKVDLSILLLSSYEILYMDDIPDVVSINEAVEIAKEYSTEKSAVFINGILAKVKKDKEEILKNEQDELNSNNEEDGSQAD